MTEPEKLVVRTPSVFKVDDKFNDERFMKVRVAVMHSGENLNRSSFDTNVIKAAKDTFKNIAVLANVISYEDENGETHLDYGGHDMHLEEDAFDKNNVRMIYDEKIVGIVPETNHFEIVHDDESGKDYAYVDAMLYREYGNYAADILESRGGTTDVSAEIYCDEIAVNAETGLIEVGKMRMSGITLLGADVNPAMKGASATVFSIKEDDLQSQMIQIMQELKTSLDNYTAALGETLKEGGDANVNKFDELLEQYGVTADDVTFEYENLSDEELEAKFAEVFGVSDFVEEVEGEDDDEIEVNEDEIEESEGSEDDDEIEVESIKFTVEFDGKIRNMSASLSEKLEALSRLVNDTYEDDGTWYSVDVYEEDRYVLMIDCWSGKGYKQSFKVKSGSYTLTGDRVEVFAKWLTQDEINKLDKMKADYAEASDKLNKYEEEPKKMDILNSDDYSLIADNEEFVELKKEQNHFNLSIEEVVQAADAILTSAAKAHKFSFAETSNKSTKTQAVKPLPKAVAKKRFGSLFDGII